jgi:hypothetical protein
LSVPSIMAGRFSATRRERQLKKTHRARYDWGAASMIG